MDNSVKRRRMDKYNYWKCFLLPWGFRDFEEEELYLAYTQEQRQRAVPRLIAIGVLLQLFTIVVPGESNLFIAYTTLALVLLVNLFLLTIYSRVRRIRSALPHVTWFALWLQLLINISRRQGDSYNELLGWAVVLQYFTCATLPFHFFLLVFYSALSLSAYLIMQYCKALSTENTLVDDFRFQVFLIFYI